MKTTSEIRQAFLDFFKSKGHTVEKSSALVPQDDPTLLFTTAGMVQFKPFFARTVTPPYTRATTSQKCLRAGGKGSDLENVGRTSRHHTFFEMLGNFSFGDYFKKDAIKWAWEFVTEVIKLPKDKLWASVYLDDAEAFELWRTETGLPAERIVKLGRADNFWGPAGDSGACGPCSEIYIDRGKEHARVGWEGVPCTNPDCKPGCDCDRYLEFWNLVFMQFFQEPDGTQRPLPHTGIDTGMGLERLASIVQDAGTVYDTDAFAKILDAIWAATGGDEPKTRPTKLSRPQQIALNCVADHARALTFAIADGAVPSNEGRGYVLRRILRRAVRFAKTIALDKPFMFDLVPVIVAQYGDVYPELKERREHIATTIHAEEQSFHNTLRRGMDLLMEYIEELKSTKQSTLSGDRAFFLHDTHGFPIDLTREMLEEKGFSLDEKGFERELEEQKKKAKKGSKFGTAGTIEFGIDLLAARPLAGPFVGYDHDHVKHQLSTDAKLAVLAPPDADGEVRFALDPTPFYPEGGGQASDRGAVKSDDFEIEVLEVRRVGEIIVHLGRVARGKDALARVKAPVKVTAAVDREHRMRTARHHTATHLLQAALRHNLGPHIQQAGSLVTSERFRFDFTHPQSLAPEVLKAIEDEVNAKILDNMPLSNREMSFKDALAAGALAFFGEKYGDKVRVVKIGEYSTELCGGTHVAATGEIGLFTITGESSVAAGTRRVEVVCGTEAREHLSKMVDELEEVAKTLKVPPSQVLKKLEGLLEKEKELAKKVKQLQDKLTSGAGAAATEIQKIDGISFITQDLGEVDMDVCRNNADRLLKTLGSGLVVVGSRAGDKACLVAKVSGDLAGKKLKAGDIVKRIAATVGGSGGGRPDMAQAGGNQPENLAKALSQVPEVVKNLLAGQA